MSKTHEEIGVDGDGDILVEHLLGRFLHREGAPASLSYYDTGHFAQEQWLINGRRHRENHPAFIVYYREQVLPGKLIRREDWLYYCAFYHSSFENGHYLGSSEQSYSR